MIKKIVFINQSTGYLTIDVINKFVPFYDQVDLIRGTMTEEANPLHKSINITSVVGKTRKSNFGRFVRWFIASLQIQILLCTRFRNHEVFYYSLPPFAYLGAIFLKRKYAIMVFDVYPDVLKGIGVSEKNPIYKIWTKANRKIFKKAHRVFTIGDGLAKLLETYTSGVEVIPLWSTLSDLKPVSKKMNPFTLKHNLQDKFVIQYSGNLGHGQNIEFLIELAKSFKENDIIHFVIIGRGTKVPIIKDAILNEKLSNITLLPFQPPEMLRYSLSNADIGVVMVENAAASSSLPSKTFNMMAVGNPILAIAPSHSELAMLINKHKNGVVFSGTSLEEIKQFIVSSFHNPETLKSMSFNSFDSSSMYTEENSLLVYKSYSKY